MVLNEDIYEFDNKEKQKPHTLWEHIKRQFYLIDSHIFQKTYKEEWEDMNVEMDKIKQRLSKSDKKNKRQLREIVKLEKKIQRLEKRLEKYEKEET